MENKKNNSGLKVFLGIVVFLLIFCIGISVAWGSIKKKFNKIVSDPEKVSNFIENIAGEKLDEEFTSTSNSLKEKYASSEEVSDPESKSSSLDENFEAQEVANPIKADDDIQNFNIYIESKAEISGAKVALKTTGTVDQVNQTEYLSSTITDLSMTSSEESSDNLDLSGIASFLGNMGLTIDMYIDLANGKSYTKMPATAAFLGVEGAGEWTASDQASTKMDIAAVLKTLSTTEKTELVGEGTYKTYISGETAANSIPSSIGEKKVDPNLFREDIPVIYTLKEGRIASIRFDFSGMGAAVDMDFYVVISNYNEAGEVVIPADVKNK